MKKGEELRMDGKTEEADGVIYFISMLRGFISNGRDKKKQEDGKMWPLDQALMGKNYCTNIVWTKLFPFCLSNFLHSYLQQR